MSHYQVISEIDRVTLDFGVDVVLAKDENGLYLMFACASGDRSSGHEEIVVFSGVDYVNISKNSPTSILIDGSFARCFIRVGEEMKMVEQRPVVLELPSERLKLTGHRSIHYFLNHLAKLFSTR